MEARHSGFVSWLVDPDGQLPYCWAPRQADYSADATTLSANITLSAAAGPAGGKQLPLAPSLARWDVSP